MADAQTKSIGTADREIVITRIFNAPRELVFKAWIDPVHIGEWWGPDGFTITTKTMNVAPGGEWRFTMHGPDGTDYPNLVVYKEIVAPERIVMYHGTGEVDAGIQFDAIITFESIGVQTKLTMKSILKTAAMRDHVIKEFGAIEGGKQTLARLAEYLTKS